MRPAQPRRERYGEPARNVAVVDEVVLGDREALPGALRRGVDAALQMQDDGALLERQLQRVRVRPLDRRRGAAGRDVAEAPAVRTARDVADAVELLAGVLERLLERELVARRDEQRMTSPRVRVASPASAARNRCNGAGAPSASTSACSVS